MYKLIVKKSITGLLINSCTTTGITGWWSKVITYENIMMGKVTTRYVASHHCHLLHNKCILYRPWEKTKTKGKSECVSQIIHGWSSSFHSYSVVS